MRIRQSDARMQKAADPITKRIQLNMRRSLLASVEEHMRRTGHKTTAAIHDLVTNGTRYGVAIEEWLADEGHRTGKSRAYLIETALWRYIERIEADRLKAAGRVKPQTDEELAESVKQAAADLRARADRKPAN